MQPANASASLLINGAQSLCLLYRIETIDGLVLRYTTADHAVVFENQTYLTGAATPDDHTDSTGALSSSAYERVSSLNEGTLDVRMSISDDGITEADLRSDRFVGAEVIEYVVDHRFPWLGAVTTQQFTIDRIVYDGETAAAEMSTLAMRLSRRRGRQHTRNCRHRLGVNDGHEGCFYNIAAVLDTITVTAVTSRTSFRCTNGSATRASGWSSFGYLEWQTGDNRGVFDVKVDTQVSGTSHDLILSSPVPFDIQVGDTATLAPGCDRRISTCEGKFNQLENYGGFNDMPGDDELLQTPNRQ